MNDSNKYQNLRRKAEQVVKNEAADLSADEQLDLLRLAHELELAHVELEVQNRQLRQVGRELEDSRNRYFDLYESAPVAYVTLGTNGIVRMTNAAARKLLSPDGRPLTGKPFSDFVLSEDWDQYFKNLKKTALSARDTPFELRPRAVVSGLACPASRCTFSAQQDASAGLLALRTH